MGTSLTRERLLEKAKLRSTKVEVDGFGVVVLRRQSYMQQSRRLAQTYNEHGKAIPLQVFTENLYAIVDQVCNEDGSPMFSEKDVATLGELDPAELRPLVEAIKEFNGDDDDGKKQAAE